MKTVGEFRVWLDSQAPLPHPFDPGLLSLFENDTPIAEYFNTVSSNEALAVRSLVARMDDFARRVQLLGEFDKFEEQIHFSHSNVMITYQMENPGPIDQAAYQEIGRSWQQKYGELWHNFKKLVILPHLLHWLSKQN